MHLKKSKEDVMWDIQMAVANAMTTEVSNIAYNFRYLTVDEVQRRIVDMMAKSVSLGISSFLENVYTDNEFESDLGLTK